MIKGMTIDYKCRRCENTIHENADFYDEPELRARLEDNRIQDVALHECSRALFGIADLLGYTKQLED